MRVCMSVCVRVCSVLFGLGCDLFREKKTMMRERERNRSLQSAPMKNRSPAMCFSHSFLPSFLLIFGWRIDERILKTRLVSQKRQIYRCYLFGEKQTNNNL